MIYKGGPEYTCCLMACQVSDYSLWNEMKGPVNKCFFIIKFIKSFCK